MLPKHYTLRLLAGAAVPLVLLLMVVLGLRYSQAQPVEETVRLGGPFRYYAETGHNVGGAFLEFYDRNGGTPIFGFPITELITDTANGLSVQYFQRARMEWHFDPATGTGDVRLSDIGSELTRTRTEPAFEQVRRAEVISGTMSVPGGGLLRVMRPSQQIFDGFAPFYTAQDGTRLFGAVLSVPMVEEIEGERYFVQYFERARLEYHPSTTAEDASVQLGLLGYELARRNEVPAAALAPVPPFTVLAAASTPLYGGTLPESANILLAAHLIDGLIVPPGGEVSFLAAIGTIDAANGFVPGLGIINDEIVPIMGGGICQVSSALYDAALWSGMDITERHQHTYFLNFFANQPGIEAAVYAAEEGWQDLRWRNPTAHPVYIRAYADRTADVVRVELWGHDGDGMVLINPVVTGAFEPEPIRILDEEMEPGTERLERPATVGLNITVVRRVVDASGNVLRADETYSRYPAVPAIVRYGPEAPDLTATAEATGTLTIEATGTVTATAEATAMPEPTILPEATEPVTQTDGAAPLVEPTPDAPPAEPTPDAPPAEPTPDAPPAEPTPDAPPAEPTIEAPPAEVAPSAESVSTAEAVMATAAALGQ